MTEKQNNDQINDQKKLTDYLLGLCDDEMREAVEARLEADEAFRAERDNIANALSALGAMPQCEAPHDLTDQTMRHIRAARRTEALLAKQEITRHLSLPSFSLRELGAVAAAAVLIAAILIPSLNQAQRNRQIAQCGSNLGQIGSAIQAFANDNDDYLPRPQHQLTRWLPSKGKSSASNSAGLFKLISSGYESPTAFLCPATGGQPFAVKSGMVDFPGQDNVSYSYQHNLGPKGLRRSDPALAVAQQHMVILADSTPVFVNGKFRSDRVDSPISDNHNRRGQNVLFLDMHVEFAKDSRAGVGGDQIYLIEGVRTYQGDESPVRPTDTFLLPAFSGE